MRRALLALLCAASFAAPLRAATRQERAQAADRARDLMRAGRWEDAAASWEQALAPGTPPRELREGLPSEGICYERTQNYQNAITAYKRALQFDERNVDRLLDLARVYAQVDLDHDALALYQRVLELDKNRHDATLAAARLYYKTGQWDDARKFAGQYVDWEPRDPAGQRLLARIDEAAGDLLEAGRRWEMIVSREPSPKAYYDLGRLWVRAARWDQADSAFSRAEDLGFRTGALYLYRGVIQWLKGDAPRAEALWRKALERSPGMGAAHFFLAMAARDAGRSASARSEAALARDGAQSDLLKSLAGNLLEQAPRKK